MNMLKTLAAAALSVAALSAHAASVEAFQNATVQPSGVRTGNNGINFFNIEGNDFGNFASYGVVRFNVASLKSQFDAQYGVNGWAIDSISLSLTQSNAAFTADGAVDVYFTGNDAISIVSPSPLQYPFAGDFADAQKVLSYNFTQISSGTLENHSLFSSSVSNNAGAQALLADILADSVVTLALVEGESGVAATYAGYNHNTYAGPTLNIEVSAVPEANGWAMLLAGLGMIAGVARRRM
jgi:MYXO-CTERM domain-containing protein